MILIDKFIFETTIDGFQSCRKLRKQVRSTDLNIRYKYIKYLPKQKLSQESHYCNQTTLFKDIQRTFFIDFKQI